MPNGPRIRANNVYGTITDNPLTAGATSFNSTELALLPTVSAAHAVITLDPLRQHGEPEIVVVTAHTSSSTVATITRGQYGTVAREHPQGTVWVHAPIDEDVREIVTSVTRPSDPYRGQGIYEIDTDRLVSRNLSGGWQQEGLFFDPPMCQVFRGTAQSIPSNTDTLVVFSTETLDNDGMYSAAAPARITINTTGLYILTWCGQFDAVATPQYITAYWRVNAGAAIAVGNSTIYTNTGGRGSHAQVHTVRRLTAGQFVEVVVVQINAGATAVNLQATVNGFENVASATWIGRGN